MGKKENWDRFYEKKRSTKEFTHFEWFFGFEAVHSLILSCLRPQTPSETLKLVLDLGCGTSALGPGIYQHSPWPVQVICVDISPVAVHLMQEHWKSSRAQGKHPSSSLRFMEMDGAELHGLFDPRSLDLIVDKGTTDALLRSREGPAKAERVLKQCLTALRNSGSLLQFSDEDPDARLLWLEGQTRALGPRVTGVRVQEVLGS
ncbi:methyltransferase-like protein 12, mitochondrial-like [Scleropages formosus]|uniref:Citrate synthase-lysine N-methyltransferase CSKMT, mitochondrial n=1 Tax=Scleropages formosus TaxID=113540 RepID=A0A0P7THI0_SCLFO|nr:methyltransferase-like protein 12, mitochondrial-like [Scleropages formosus]